MRTDWTGIGARIRSCVEPGRQLRVGRKLLGSKRTMVVHSSKQCRLEPFPPVRRVAETAGLFRMAVLGRVGRSWQLIRRPAGALAWGLRAKFEISKGVLEIPYRRRMEDIVSVHDIQRGRGLSYKDGLCRLEEAPTSSGFHGESRPHE